jgi:hypothetical protein
MPRDQRLIAVHRGGPLSRANHQRLAKWAADCAAKVLPLFEQHSSDTRPRQALATARDWAAGNIATGVAMRASVACHAAARAATDKAAIAAARAAGHAVATAHFAEHALGGLLYALKALQAANKPIVAELQRRLKSAPAAVRVAVRQGVEQRLKSFKLVLAPVVKQKQQKVKTSAARKSKLR